MSSRYDFICPTHVDVSKLSFSSDEDLIQSCAYMNHIHPNYGLFAGRVYTLKMRERFTTDIKKLYQDLYTKYPRPLVSKKMYDLVMSHHEQLNEMIKLDRDMMFDFMAIRTLEKTYLMPGELPQFMYMRVAMELHGDDMETVNAIYDDLSLHCYTFATPTLINAGRTKCQMASCFLSEMKDDSIEGIFETLKECAMISQTAGGLGVHLHFSAGTSGGAWSRDTGIRIS